VKVRTSGRASRLRLSAGRRTSRRRYLRWAGSDPVAKSEFFTRPLPAAATAALVELVQGRPAGESRELDFMPRACAYNRVPPTVTAFVHRRQIEQVGCLTAAAETRRFWADLPVGEAGAGHRPRTRCRAALRTRRPSRLVDLAGCANRSWLRTDSSWLR
jgi:hypothetical protein